MPRINEKELYTNMLRFYSYSDPKCSEYSFFKSILQKGRNYVVLLDNGQYHFCPSRFIGYANNSKTKHLADFRDGRQSDIAINELIESRPKPNKKFEKKIPQLV